MYEGCCEGQRIPLTFVTMSIRDMYLSLIQLNRSTHKV